MNPDDPDKERKYPAPIGIYNTFFNFESLLKEIRNKQFKEFKADKSFKVFHNLECLNLPVLVEANWPGDKHFLAEFEKNILLPKKIDKILNELFLFHKVREYYDPNKTYVTISHGTSDPFARSKEKYWHHPTHPYLRFEDFCNKCVELKSAIDNWIKNPGKPKLNIY